MRKSSPTRWILGLSSLYFLGLMHIYIPNRGGNGFYMPGNMVGASLMALMTIVGLWPRRQPLRSSSLFAGIIVATGLLLLPLSWSVSPWRETAILRLLGLLLGIGVYAALLQCPLNRWLRHHIMLLLLLSTAVEAALGILQYYVFTSNNFMEYNASLGRPYGIFQQWNVMASFIATGLALALYLWADPLTRRLGKILAGLMLVLAPLLLLIIVSRIGLLASLLVAPLQLWALRIRDKQRFWWAVGLIFAGIMLALLTYTFNNVVRNVTDAAPISSRLLYWKEALNMITEHPLWGWGYGRFKSAFLYSYYAHHIPPMEAVGVAGHPHNEWLYWGIEGGVIALTGLAIFVGAVGRRCLQHIRLGPMRFSRYCRSPWLVMVPIVLHTQVEYPLYQSAAHCLTLLLLLRVCDVRTVLPTEVISTRFTQWYRWVCCAAASIMFLYMLNGLWAARIITKVERQGLRHTQDMDNLIKPHPWEGRQEYDRQLSQLLRYQQSPDIHLLQDYRQWGEISVRRQPDATVYHNLMVVYRLLNNPVRSEVLRREAQRLFPQDERFTELAEKP